MVTDLSLTESLLAMTWKHSLVANSDNDGAVGTTKGLAGKAVRLSAMFALARVSTVFFELTTPLRT